MADLKPAYTFEQQLQLLIDRGLIIQDRAVAEYYLKNRNYYRLNVYFHHYLDKNNRFLPGVSLETILFHETMDSWFRRSLAIAFENIELHFRTLIAYHLAHMYGADAFYRSDPFIDNKKGNDLLISIRGRFDSNDPVINHHKKHYGGMLPTWVMIEYLSFAELSIIYSNLKLEVQKRIGTEFWLYPTLIRSWLHCFSNVRNICAHHGYLFRRELPIYPKIHKDYQDKVDYRYIFAVISCLPYLMSNDEWVAYLNRIKSLQQREPALNLSDYGFPLEWEAVLAMKK